MKEFFEILPSVEFFCFKYAQANIVALLDNTGVTVVKYKYDAWGKCQTTVVDSSATTIAELNPFRYRSYYLDTETGFYFLKTRYYDPEIGRFMTIDDISYLDPDSINGLNLYAYCGNSPANNADSTGTFAISTFLLGLAISFFVTWAAGEIFGHQLVGGIGSAVGGGSAIATGISLLAYGPVGWVIGGIAIIAGAASIAFGTAEIQEHFTGNNWIQNSFGWSDGLYNGLYFASNIVASVASVGGTFYKTTTHGQRAYALQNVKRFGYTKSVKAHMNSYFGKKYGSTGIISGKLPDIRPYTNSLWAQKTIIKYGMMTADDFGWVFTLDGYRLGINNQQRLIWHFGRGF